MLTYHPLLERQLRQHIQDADLSGPWSAFLATVSNAYHDADTDRQRTEQSLKLTSAELTDRNAHLRNELAERQRIELALRDAKTEQAALTQKLETVHHQLVQSGKMASIGQLAAGLAHELNNPIGFVRSNMGTLSHYFSSLIEALSVYETHLDSLGREAKGQVTAALRSRELSHIREDGSELLSESLEGIQRVCQIVRDLKDFSRVDEAKWLWANLHCGLDSTLNIVNNEVKYVADVVKHYGALPAVQCMPSQLNQVFLNILINASQSIQGKRGTITIRTQPLAEEGLVCIEISDDGSGIPAANLKRIFDPFFTTKPAGKGTGLGLSLSYSIVERHRGRIEVQSELGVGTMFRIILPAQQDHVTEKEHEDSTALSAPWTPQEQA